MRVLLYLDDNMTSFFLVHHGDLCYSVPVRSESRQGRSEGNQERDTRHTVKRGWCTCVCVSTKPGPLSGFHCLSHSKRSGAKNICLFFVTHFFNPIDPKSPIVFH